MDHPLLNAVEDQLLWRHSLEEQGAGQNSTERGLKSQSDHPQVYGVVGGTWSKQPSRWHLHGELSSGNF